MKGGESRAGANVDLVDSWHQVPCKGCLTVQQELPLHPAHTLVSSRSVEVGRRER